MDSPKVSVIIPIYNVEKYISKCLDSLFSQTMEDGIEFIFVNDCTPDNSIEILLDKIKEYPNREKQVKIIHHEINKGIAETRYDGIKAANGLYVIHCDSDDWVDITMYQQLYNKAIEINADIVGCDCYQVFGKKTIEKKENFDLPQEQLMEELIKGKQIEGYLWNRLVKREFYVSHKFRAEKGITYLDDMAVTVPMHASTSRVGYVSKPLYFYRRGNENSISGFLSQGSIQSGIKVLEKLYLTKMMDKWRELIKLQIRDLLFFRILGYSTRQVEEWKKFELPILQNYNLPFTEVQKWSIWLISHGFDKMQFVLMLNYKLYNKFIKYFKNKI